MAQPDSADLPPRVVNQRGAPRKRTLLGGKVIYGDGQQVIFESLAFLIACPVHEQAIAPVHHDDGHEHIAEDSEGSDASQESDD